MATVDDKREEGEREPGGGPEVGADDPNYEFLDNPLYDLYGCFRGIYRIYNKRGFTLFALGLIAIGLIFCTIFYSMDVPRPGEPLLGWVAIRACWQWALIIGIGYFLFKLLLLGVGQASKAAQKGSAEAAPPPAQDTTPPDEEEPLAGNGKKEAPGDLKTRLRTLEDLRNDGLLTDAEYQAKREVILGEV